jgi:hypothetical protein
LSGGPQRKRQRAIRELRYIMSPISNFKKKKREKRKVVLSWDMPKCDIQEEA